MSKLIIPGKHCYRTVCGLDGGRIVIEVAICNRVDSKTFMVGSVRYNFGTPDCPWHPSREAAIQRHQTQADSDNHPAFQIYAAATICEAHFEFALLSDSEDVAEQLNAKVLFLPLCQGHPITLDDNTERPLTESPNRLPNQKLPA